MHLKATIKDFKIIKSVKGFQKNYFKQAYYLERTKPLMYSEEFQLCLYIYLYNEIVFQDKNLQARVI